MARSSIPVALRIQTSGLAKSEIGLVKKNGALLDRCTVNLFRRARRLHFIGRKKRFIKVAQNSFQHFSRRRF